MNVPTSSCVLKQMSHAMPRQLTSNRSSVGGGGIRVLETHDAAIRRTRLRNERLAEARVKQISSTIRVRASKLTGPLGSLTSHMHDCHIVRLTSNSSILS